MKAVLHETHLERYECVYEGKKDLELTGETVVTDKMPDIGLLCDTNAQVLLRSKRTEQGSVIMDGDVEISVSYLPDGGTGFRVLDIHLPCGTEFENESITSDSTATGTMRVKRWETRMLNPRKILVKLQLECSVQVYEKRKTMICDASEENERLQACKEECLCTVISTVCERTFAATDEVPLSSESAGGEILGKRVQFRTDDVKTLANKLIVKGSMLSDVILAKETGETEVQSFTTPFSMIAETDCEAVSGNAVMRIMPTAMYYELTSGGQVLSVEVHAVCQMVIYEPRQLAFLSDAYSNYYPCECEFDQLTVYGDLKKESYRENISESVVCRSSLNRIGFLTAAYDIYENGETAELVFLIGAAVEYDNGSKDWIKKQIVWPVTLKDKDVITDVRISDLYGTCSGSELLFRFNVEWDSVAEKKQIWKHLSGVQWDESASVTPRQSSLTLVRGGGNLWELAKRFGSTVDLICLYNEIEAGMTEADGLLLIPRQVK